MSQINFNITIDKDLEQEFENLCKEQGTEASTVINMFIKKVVLEKNIPFEFKASDDAIREEALKAFLRLREEAKKNGLQDMTLDEINEEIYKARRNID